MKKKYWLAIAGMFLLGCMPAHYHVVQVENPDYHPNTVFLSSEDLSSPKFAHLISKYRLDTVFHGEKDEFKRILLLRHWIKSVIAIDDHGEPYPGDGYTEGILDAALKGHGFHCGHYMTVQNGIMNAFGYVTRTLGAGPGVKGGPDGHHGIDEIWSNQFQKWFLSDAKYDHHFEKNGIPLSALEIRDEFLKNKGADIIKVKGPDRISIDADPETGLTKIQNAQTYTWIEWHGYNDLFTSWPDHKELLIMYADDYFKNHTWIWDGKPHWAYSQPEYMKKVEVRNAIYWTPNTIHSTVTVEGKLAHVVLDSQTPNLKEYRMQEQAGGEWIPVNAMLDIPLKGQKTERIICAVNLAGVCGPEHRIVIEKD
jgi:hypothetical protein